MSELFDQIYNRFVEFEILRRITPRKIKYDRKKRDQENAKSNTDRKWLAQNRPNQWIK